MTTSITTDKLVAYKVMPTWDKATVPDLVLNQHNTMEGTWAKLTILAGQLRFSELTESGETLSETVFTPETPTPFVSPQAWHKVALLTDDSQFYITFYCQPEDYFSKKYNLGKTHSEVLAAAPLWESGKVLDLGAGSGRNSLYLAQQGHQVTALDRNPQGLALIDDIAEQEQLDVTTGLYDINQAKLTDDYNVIISTVVLMFLQAERIPDVITDMQNHTLPGGYNLIVCAMSTDAYPCNLPFFGFTFSEGELADYYKDWEVITYNENLGHLHKRDANGNPIALQFATLLARKPL
ncbi:SAM-dependent methyltransferase TehB [Streptococcus sp. DD12]|uniref:SAM-dependent methyltransferase TehB n=1 Tax=Streptococcus sp. DD12 TaxID=1777880 RepID=UPI00079724DC|nr:SAM-dependent methyltransferase TehB [Streptococcus sp. DD12]KXT75765.1 Tellurite resistance protein TehB [Streptococcus sp. DD12]